MGREHRLDPHAAEEILHLGEAHPGIAQTPHRLGQASRLRHAALRRLPLVVPGATETMDRLGQVHHLEIGRERPHQLGRLGRSATAHQGEQRAVVLLHLPALDRRQARRLHRLEELLAALLPQHLPHQGAQRADVLPQSGVFGGKDIALAHGPQHDTTGAPMAACNVSRPRHSLLLN
jgi:hypothetical protein